MYLGLASASRFLKLNAIVYAPYNKKDKKGKKVNEICTKYYHVCICAV